MIRRIAQSELGEVPLSPQAVQLRANLAPLVAPRAPSTESVQRALRALLGEELALKPEHIRSVVERELLRLRRARVISLHVHPLDAGLLEPSAAYRERLELRGTLEVVEDTCVSRGGCLITSNLGHTDASLETRLAAALELLAAGAFDEP